MSSNRDLRLDERRKVLRKVVERVKDTLLSSNKDFVVIQFPTRYKERSIDIVAVDRGGRNLVIRIKLTPTINKDEAEDLIKASLALNAIPLMVSHDVEIYDNIVYEKEGIYVLNERTLENLCLRPTELVALYRKGDLYVSLDSKEFRKLKEIKKYSLSELSYKTGISRRTLFEYERDDAMISINTAEKLVNTLGDNVIKAVDLKVMYSEFMRRFHGYGGMEKVMDSKLRNIIADRKESIEGIYDLKKSAPDYIIKEDDNVETVVDATVSKYTIKEVIKKIAEAFKISELVSGGTRIIVERSRGNAIIDELSTQISINKLEIIKIKD